MLWRGFKFAFTLSFLLLWTSPSELIGNVDSSRTTIEDNMLSSSQSSSKSSSLSTTRILQAPYHVQKQDVVKSTRSATRELLQNRDPSQTEIVSACDLSSEEVRRFYKESSRQWLINDAVLGELDSDVQRIIECSNENDLVLFQTNHTIKPKRTLLLFNNLTLTSHTEGNRDSRGDPSANNRVRFTCPDSGQLLISRSLSLTLESMFIEDCTSSTSVIELTPECNSQQLPGQIRLLNITIRQNVLTGQGHLIKTGSASCLQLTMDSVLIRSNDCTKTHCIVLSANNTLNEIQLIRNQASGDNAMDSSIFSVSNSSLTVVTNMISRWNQIQSFHLSNGDVFLSSSTFEENLRNHLASDREEANGGGVIFAVYSRLAISNCLFRRNVAIHGSGIFASFSEIMVQDSAFLENDVGKGYGGAIYTQSSNLTIFSTRFDSNSAKFGGSLYSKNTTLEVTNSTFINGVASGSGGAIYMQQSNATLENVTIMSNEAQDDCGGMCVLDASHVEANNLLVEDNRARNVGGGIVAANASSLLCYSCLILGNRAFSGAGLYVFSNNSIPLVAQLQESRFENNSARSYGGGIELSAPQNRSIVCGEQGVKCGRMVLLNTDFISNYATYSGAVVLTTNARALLVSCNYNESGRDFVDEEFMRSLSLVHPDKLCPSWRNNRLSTNATGGLVGTYGQEIIVTMSTNGEAELVGNTSSGFVIQNVNSGRQLPTINVIVLDEYGVGPAPTLPYSFEAVLCSPDLFFCGLYPANISAGSGNFSEVAGFARPGKYILEIVPDNPSIETVRIDLIVRECQVGEESTRDGRTCQECDAFSYNFNSSEVGGCKECPGDAICRGRYIVPKKGHWHKSPCHDTVQECLVEDACSYKDREEALANFTQNSTDCGFNETALDSYNDALCNEGYEGPLCGSCKKSFGLSVRFLCLECASRLLSILTLIGITLYLLATSSFTIRGCLPVNWRPQDQKPTIDESAHTLEISNRDPEVNVEMVRMMVEGHVPPEYFKNRQEASTSHTPSNSTQQETEYELTRWRTTEIFKIILNFLQTTAVAATVSVHWTDGLLNLFETAEYVGALTTVALSRPIDCIVSSSSPVVRAIWRMLMSLFAPGVVVGIFVSMWGYLTVKKRKGALYFWKRCTLSVIAVTYISYLGLSNMAVRAFYCIDIYDSNNEIANTSRRFWSLDTSIQCYGKDHSSIIAIAVVVLCLVTMLFPLVSGIILSRNKERHKKRDSWVFETAGFLFRAFKESCPFWESLVMLRKACLSVIVVFAYPLGGDSQGLLASVLLLFCLYIHLTLRPYRRDFAILNHFESCSLLVSALTFILGLFFANNRCGDSVKTSLAAIIILGNCMFFLGMSFALFYSTLVHLRVLLRCENIPLANQAPWWIVLQTYIVSRTRQFLECSQRS